MGLRLRPSEMHSAFVCDVSTLYTFPIHPSSHPAQSAPKSYVTPCECHSAHRSEYFITALRTRRILRASNTNIPSTNTVAANVFKKLPKSAASQPDWSCQPAGFSILLRSKYRDVPVNVPC